jgi:DNA (cytosine-5)-methyltransferase 1
MKAFYNEHDPKAAAWLRELIKDSAISQGTVDERSIEDVIPAELAQYERVHCFSGIGIWDYALNEAGWTGSVWTGSCPCQPFSAAGKGKGFADERHLWPAWFHLISQCRPNTIFGEQVSSKDGITWLDTVLSDLEGIGYTVAPLDIPAAGVGAPHIRQRIYFVANSMRGRIGSTPGQGVGTEAAVNGQDGRISGQRLRAGIKGTTGGLADCLGHGRRTRWNSHRENDRCVADPICDIGGTLALTNGRDARTERQQRGGEQRQQPQDGRSGRDMADTLPAGWPEGWPESGNGQTAGSGSELDDTNGQRRQEQRHGLSDGQEQPRIELPGFTNGFWRDAEWIYCKDGKYRPTQPEIFPLAYGNTAGRVGLLRGAGNALVAPQAIEFIKAAMEVLNEP